MCEVKSVTQETSRGCIIQFPGPLLCGETRKEDVMRFIKAKCQDCFSHLDDPDQRKSFFFWRIMELFCKRDGKAMMAEIVVVVFRAYGSVRRMLGLVKDEENWCLPLAKLLCSKAPEVEHRRAVVKMGDDFACRNWIFAAHLCYVGAQLPLGTRRQFQLIGCDWFDTAPSVDSDMMERTEVFEFVLSLRSGLGQLHFQKYKYMYAKDLFNARYFDKALLYCENIVKNIFQLPRLYTSYFLERVIMLSTRLLEERLEEAEWLFKCCCLHKAFTANNVQFSKFILQPSSCSYNLHEFQEELNSQFIVGELLGKGYFGAVYAGVRKADGRQVAVKYVPNNYFLPGSKPREVELMEIVCKAPRCESVVELLEWFNMESFYILVLEHPNPCMDLRKLCSIQKNRQLPEFSAREVMRQLVQAIRHCFERGVLHEDIHAYNILVNTETLETRLIDFGCAKLMVNSTGSLESFQRLYVWDIVILLLDIISADRTICSVNNIIHKCSQFVTKECCNLISHCLKEPAERATFDEILSHDWFKLKLERKFPALDTDPETLQKNAKLSLSRYSSEGMQVDPLATPRVLETKRFLSPPYFSYLKRRRNIKMEF